MRTRSNNTIKGLALSLAAAAVSLTSPSAEAASGIWTNPSGGSWTNAANWSSGTIGDASGATADFGALNLTADATVTLDGARTIGSLVFGDTTPDRSWFLNPGSGGELTLAVSTGNHVYTGMGGGGSTVIKFSGGTFTVVPDNGAVTFSIGGNDYGKRF